MFHLSLGMPWGKEQVENRLSQVRNQSSSLIRDEQATILVVVVNVCVRVCVCVCVCRYLAELGLPPLDPHSISHI